MPRSEVHPRWITPAPLGGGHHYLALRDHIARQIEDGRLPPGTRLPSERQLQLGAGIARGTIREALFQLEAEGRIHRKDRSGWFVSPPPIIYEPTRGAGFMTYVAEQGRRPETVTLSAKKVRAGPLGPALGLGPEVEVYVVRRQRLIDGQPVLVENIAVNPDLAPDLLKHSFNGSLSGILRSEYGLTAVRAVVDMQPCALVREEAAALGVKSGAPGLLVVRTNYDAQGRVVEYDHEYWRHSALKIHVEAPVD